MLIIILYNILRWAAAYTNTNCAPFLHIGHECPSCCPADSRRTHLPWQWGADSTVHLVARSIVPCPGHRNPSDWRITCVSQRTHTRSPVRKNRKRMTILLSLLLLLLCRYMINKYKQNNNYFLLQHYYILAGFGGGAAAREPLFILTIKH